MVSFNDAINKFEAYSVNLFEERHHRDPLGANISPFGF